MADELVDASSFSTVVPSTHSALLDVTKIHPTIGIEQKKRALEILHFVEQTDIPPYLIGPSGSGKTQALKAVAATYAKRHNVPAYYLQLSQEDTKTTVLLGLRLVKGSLEVVEGVVAECARKHGIIALDEITHSTHQLLLMLNSLDGNDSVITIGDRRVDVSNMKILYGSNDSGHAGNIKVPQSFANRVVSWQFNYPSFEEEVAISYDLAQRNCRKVLTVPKSAVQFFTSFAREIRRPDWPLSVRNIAHAILLFQFAPILNPQMSAKTGLLDVHFTGNNNNEALRLSLSKRIMNKEIKDTTMMHHPSILEFLEFVSKIGVDSFKQRVLQAINFYVDMEGLNLFDEELREKIVTSII